MTPLDSPYTGENDEAIRVRGARAHNLKNVNIDIPRGSLTVITGPSGSGKSTLAFDTIYSEGQRRYVESLSAYARQFLEKTPKPEVESISGLSPTISIEQRTTSYNPRSTVGTVTEIYDYLRLLFARISKPFCWKCGDEIQSQSPQQMTDLVLAFEENTRVSILAPIVRGRKGEYLRELNQLRQRGFVRVRIDGETRDLEEEIHLDKKKKHDIEVYIDRLVVKGDRAVLATRVSESIELGLKLGSGLVLLEFPSRTKGEKTREDLLLSEKFACAKCQVNYPEPEPRTFSFNSPMGACPECDGMGYVFEEFEEEDWEDEEEEDLEEIGALLQEPETCPNCEGARLRKESLHFKINGKNIAHYCHQSIGEFREALPKLRLSKREKTIGSRILKEIQERLDFLGKVGVDYLSLDRPAKTLSGGEAQRIRLATQIGSSLVGVIYVLDEPSIGLHPRDHHRLLKTLTHLRDLGNSVLVVEHDRETMETADFLIDLGPGAGRLGGEVVAKGTPAQVKKNRDSVTGKYLSGKLEIPRFLNSQNKEHDQRRPIRPDRVLKISGVQTNNLKNVDVEFPLGLFICVTGVSGSGKSSLVLDTLYPVLYENVMKTEAFAPEVRSVTGLEFVDKVIDIDQKPIGKTPRSNPATYTGLFSLIRELFASLPESKVRGYKPGRFSFNVKGGRCDACDGDGVTRVEMHFLPDVFVRCDVCKGLRYNRDTQDIKFKGKSIADVLNLTVAEAYEFFSSVPHLKTKLKVLNDVGLGYIHLGQAATTLSGGEAQRIKLSKELSRRSTGKTVYILDEPTTGLHFDDIRKLIAILQALVDQGNTVIVIEHCLDLIQVADHLIDLGPEGGKGGGQIIAKGTPEAVSRVSKSHTGRFLRGS